MNEALGDLLWVIAIVVILLICIECFRLISTLIGVLKYGKGYITYSTLCEYQRKLKRAIKRLNAVWYGSGIDVTDELDKLNGNLTIVTNLIDALKSEFALKRINKCVRKADRLNAKANKYMERVNGGDKHE